MQQLLPFTVLKLLQTQESLASSNVATALTVYGIETSLWLLKAQDQPSSVATALTVYGIETHLVESLNNVFGKVATALTVYGIETFLQILPT